MKEGRLHLRVPDELKQRIQDFADRHHTTVTALVTDYFTQLLAEEEKQKNRPVDADQI